MPEHSEAPDQPLPHPWANRRMRGSELPRRSTTHPWATRSPVPPEGRIPNPILSERFSEQRARPVAGRRDEGEFEPELLGIDRLVRTAEDMGTALRGKAAQVWLDNGNIRMASLD